MVRPLKIVIRYNRVGRRRPSRFVDRWTAGAAAAALFQNEYIREKALEELPILGELRVVRDSQRVRRSPRSRASRLLGACVARTSHGIAPNEFVVVSAGFAEAEKRFDLSVDAVGAARESRHRCDVRLLRRRSVPRVARGEGRERGRESEVARHAEPECHARCDRRRGCDRASVAGGDLRKRARRGNGAVDADRGDARRRQRRDARRRRHDGDAARSTIAPSRSPNAIADAPRESGSGAATLAAAALARVTYRLPALAHDRWLRMP